MHQLSYETLEVIAGYTILQLGDHFPLFALNRSWAFVIRPIAIAWEISFALDEQVRDELEIKFEQREQDRRAGIEWLVDQDSDVESVVSSYSFLSDGQTFQGYEFWARWAGTP